LHEPPAVIADEGWVSVEPFPSLEGTRSFVSGYAEVGRLRVAYFRRTSDGAVVGRAWFGAKAEGPPGHVHGGAVAAVLDEAMGAAAWLAGHVVMAARLTVNFRRMVPLGSDVLFETGLGGREGRKVITHARLYLPGGDTLADAEGLFIELQEAQLDAIRHRLGV
jgi:acyl-coenzyme A thioesterase PaaI-like protein